MASWVALHGRLRLALHATAITTISSLCALVAVDTYNVAVEQVPVTARDPIVSGAVSKRFQPRNLAGVPAADIFEYPVPLQWLKRQPDANELARRVWLSWPLRVQRWLLGRYKSSSSIHDLGDIERSELRPGTSLLDHFEVIEAEADGSSVIYRFGNGPDPREVDGILRFTAAIEGDDLAVFGFESAMWSPLDAEFPGWLMFQLHKIYTKTLLTAAVQDMLRPVDERIKYQKTVAK